MTGPKLLQIPLTQLIESPFNPRKYFDPESLTQLVASMKAHGQLNAALARPAGKKFELAAGHRRFRAAARAELETLDVVVRDLTDTEFFEILTIENDEREDVHPLEQAAGYELLITRAGYDVAKIAARLQRGHDFVYDRLSLLKLIAPLKKHFYEGHFTLGHAIILSKVTTEQQQQLNDVDQASNGRFNGQESGLWRLDYSLFHDDEKAKGAWPYQPHSVGELQDYVNRHIRFRPEEVPLEIEYPETAAVLEAAEETGTKVVHITRNYMLSSDARDPKVRTYGERSWQEASGKNGSSECEHMVVGLFVDGDERGQTLPVCVARDRCTTHWKSEVNAAARRKKDREKANAGDKSAAKRVANQPAAKKDAATIEREERERAIEAALTPALLEGARKLILKAPAAALGGKGSVAKFLLGELESNGLNTGKIDMKKVGTTAVDLVRFLALEAVQQLEDDNWGDGVDQMVKLLGVDAKTILVRVTAECTPIKPEKIHAKK